MFETFKANYEAYNRFSLKVILVAIPLFFLVWIWQANRTSDCPSKKEAVREKLEFLKNPDAIVELQLKKMKYEYARNLVNNELNLTDQSILEQVRQMINQRKRGRWNRPTREWETMMNLILVSGDTLQIEVAKIEDGKMNKTHLYFMFDECHDEYPSYSLSLGTYLEEVTSEH